jgi:hypothetical protein
MTPAQDEAWRILLDRYDAFPAGWCIIGGQMVWLLAHEYGVEPIRATDDVDIAALDSAEPIEIQLGDRMGHVLRPTLISAILPKQPLPA